MYCPNCGSEVNDYAVVCLNCGASVEPMNLARRPRDNTMATIIKVFMILGCIAEGWAIIPLIWCIPMTVSVFNSLKTGRPISTGMKVCVLIFVSLISGICLLCSDDI